jgi:hypothetical protein
MQECFKDVFLIKISNPDSKHNKKLMADNNYFHGRSISMTASIPEMKSRFRDAGLMIPTNNEERRKILKSLVTDKFYC